MTITIPELSSQISSLRVLRLCWRHSSISFKYRHLSGRTDLRIFRSNGKEAHRVPVTLTNLLRPLPELRARPLEPMILVTKHPRRQTLKPRVVLNIRRRQHHRTRLRKLKKHTLEHRHPRLAAFM